MVHSSAAGSLRPRYARCFLHRYLVHGDRNHVRSVLSLMRLSLAINVQDIFLAFVPKLLDLASIEVQFLISIAQPNQTQRDSNDAILTHDARLTE